MSAELIKGTFSNPDQMSIPQRRLWEENQNLVNGNLNAIPQLNVRYHHFFNYYFTGQKFVIARENIKPTKPWEFTNLDLFIRRISEFSLSVSREKLSFYKDRIDSTSIVKDRLDFEDYIGDDRDLQDGYALSWQLLINNFLLRAYRDKSQEVKLSYDIDGVCAACKGGIDGSGRHCLDIVKPEQSRDAKMRKRLLSIKEQDEGKMYNDLNIRPEGLDTFIPLQYFFISPFGILLSSYGLEKPTTL